MGEAPALRAGDLSGAPDFDLAFSRHRWRRIGWPRHRLCACEPAYNGKYTLGDSAFKARET